MAISFLVFELSAPASSVIPENDIMRRKINAISCRARCANHRQIDLTRTPPRMTK